jgi:GntR family transcriptional regulator
MSLPLPRRRQSLVDAVREQLASDIRAGRFAPGSRLASEAELCQHLGVSRITLRSALRSLQEAGLVVARQGAGTFVTARERGLQEGLDRLCSVDELARELGAQAGTEDLEVSREPAGGEVVRKLSLEPGAMVSVVRRVKTYSGHRVAWMVDTVPDAVFRHRRLRREFEGSVLDVLLAHHDVGVDIADTEILPMVAGKAVARLLGIAAIHPLLYMDEVLKSVSGKPIEWGQAWLVPEYFRFTIQRRRKGAW